MLALSSVRVNYSNRPSQLRCEPFRHRLVQDFWWDGGRTLNCSGGRRHLGMRETLILGCGLKFRLLGKMTFADLGVRPMAKVTPWDTLAHKGEMMCRAGLGMGIASAPLWRSIIGQNVPQI